MNARTQVDWYDDLSNEHGSSIRADDCVGLMTNNRSIFVEPPFKNADMSDVQLFCRRTTLKSVTDGLATSRL
jgi:hypothetical protein